jgi:hypothetical protein
MLIQSIVFPKNKYTGPEAITWLKLHNKKHHKVDETANTFRFRQEEPISGANYYTKQLPNGINLVILGR